MSAVEQEIKLIKKRLDNHEKEDSSAIQDMLKALTALTLTLEILSATKIGISVNSIRKAYKSTNTDISTQAGALVGQWKNVADSGRKSSSRPKKAVDYSEDSQALNVETSDVPHSILPKEGKGVKGGRPTQTKIYDKKAPAPSRNQYGEFLFPDYPDFRPNLSPKEVLQMGSFGGTYFRPIKSGCTGKTYGEEVFKEFPEDWLKGLNLATQIKSMTYRNNVNTYKVKCGGDLDMWESSGWMRDSDPYGWFQWYCRFFQGRRCADDDRQVSRGLQCMGPKGRWKGNLCGKVISSMNGRNTAETEVDNFSISPVIRQTLQHWGYKLTERDLMAYKKRTGK